MAQRKVCGLLDETAQVRVVSPDVTEGLAALAEQGRIEWRQKKYDSSDLEGAFLVFAATDNRKVQAGVCADAEQSGLLLNVADAPNECDFQVPASFRRGDLTIAITTNGKSPAVAAMVRKQLEKTLGNEYALLLDLMSIIRKRVLTENLSHEQKRILFQNVLHDDIVNWLKCGRWDRLQQHLQGVLGQGIDLDLSVLKQDLP